MLTPFQSTLPRRERPFSLLYEPNDDLFQSTLPRKERRCCGQCVWKYASHFNPRSHEGSDFVYFCHIRGQIHFNPRSHEGSDPKTRTLSTYLFISIHAPTKGATGIGAMRYDGMPFQSTLPRRERHNII